MHRVGQGPLDLIPPKVGSRTSAVLASPFPAPPPRQTQHADFPHYFLSASSHYLFSCDRPPLSNPIEKLWKKIKEKEVHLHYFPTFESLKNKIEEALLHFKDLRNEVLSLFGFYWDKLEA